MKWFTIVACLLIGIHGYTIDGRMSPPENPLISKDTFYKISVSCILNYEFHDHYHVPYTSKPFQYHAKCPQGIPLRGNEVSDSFNHTRMGVFMKNMRKCTKEISHDLGC
jgi:hypothetical protein